MPLCGYVTNIFVYFIFQIVNENSLKQLSSYIETLQQNRPTRPTTVTFYLRNQNTLDTGNYSCYEVRLPFIVRCTHACMGARGGVVG